MVITQGSVNMLGDNGQTLVSFPTSSLKKVKQYDRAFAFSSSSGKYFISIMDPKSFRNNQLLGTSKIAFWFVRKKLQSPVSMSEVRNALKSHGIKVQGQISTFA
ncbi:MAG TPA: hypothetical protein VMR95_01610 [Candidatus Binatia bacterium]|nr:hypothetical protein [Candidatus Binatia bacterium]